MTCDYRECDVQFDPSNARHRFCTNVCKDRERRAALKDLERLDTPVAQGEAAHLVVKDRRGKAPKGWEPGVRMEGDTGEGVTVPTVEPDPDERQVLTLMGLDADRWAVVGSLRVSTWQSAAGDWLYAYRAQVARREDAEAHRVDLDDCLAAIAGWTPPDVPAEDGDDAIVVALSDWQLGNGEGGGSVATVQRVLRMIDGVERRIQELRALGRPVGWLYVFLLGDLVEGCDGFYAMQQYGTDADRRSQVKVVRRLLLEALTRWAPYFPEGQTVVAGVAGNHGENRKDGKAYTTFADNDDVAVIEQVADVFQSHREDVLRAVRFVVPDDRLALTIDVAGTPVGIVHGHQFGGGANAQKKALEWWKGQAFGLRDGLSEARILVSAHFHHLTVTEHVAEEDGAGRWHFQTPAMDGGSRWFADLTGSTSKAGTLTFRVTATGWDDLAVVS